MQAVFQRRGVSADKLAVIPEPVDTAFFDPAIAEALPLPRGELVFGRSVSAQEAQTVFKFVSVRRITVVGLSIGTHALTYAMAVR